MKKILLAGFSLVFLFVTSCESPEEKAAEKAKQDSLAVVKNYIAQKKIVDSAENVMRADKTYNMKNAMGTLKAYNDFVTKFPNDSLTAEYLFRAADLSQGAKQYTQAVNYLETILANHKDYPKSDIACFMAAYIYDTYLEDVNHGGDRAIQLYQFVIDNYPNSSWAEQAKVLITYVGTSDEAMINDIIKKGNMQESELSKTEGKQSTEKPKSDSKTKEK